MNITLTRCSNMKNIILGLFLLKWKPYCSSFSLRHRGLQHFCCILFRFLWESHLDPIYCQANQSVVNPCNQPITSARPSNAMAFVKPFLWESWGVRGLRNSTKMTWIHGSLLETLGFFEFRILYSQFHCQSYGLWNGASLDFYENVNQANSSWNFFL